MSKAKCHQNGPLQTYLNSRQIFHKITFSTITKYYFSGFLFKLITNVPAGANPDKHFVAVFFESLKRLKIFESIF